LEYYQPIRRPPAVTAGVFFRFTGAFVVTFLVVMAWFRGLDFAGLYILASFVLATLSGGLVALTAVLRRRFSENWLPERSAAGTLLAGGGCVVVPTAVSAIIVGMTETWPWVVTTWFVCSILASYVISPSMVKA